MVLCGPSVDVVVLRMFLRVLLFYCVPSISVTVPNDSARVQHDSEDVGSSAFFRIPLLLLRVLPLFYGVL